MKLRLAIGAALITALIYSASALLRANLILNEANVVENDLAYTGKWFGYPTRTVKPKDSEARQKDEKGVYVLNHSKISNFGTAGGVEYSPVIISLQVLAIYDQSARVGQLLDREGLKANCNWLAENIRGNGTWVLTVDRVREGERIEGPWVSSLSQGLAISALVRCGIAFNDDRYVSIASQGLKPFTVPVDSGGILSQNKFGVFFEEYPLSEPNHVLNGFIYALFGLYDLSEYAHNEEARALFDQGVSSLASILERYDLSGWSAYSLASPTLRNHYNYSSPLYHRLHSVQLRMLASISGKSSFSTMADKFESQLHSVFAYGLTAVFVVYMDVARISNMVTALGKH